LIKISDKDGEQLVRLARLAVKKYLDESTIIDSIDQDQLSQEAGVFVTLYYLGKNKEEHLRGCIGLWIMQESQLYKFEAIVYKEAEPNGKILKLI